MKINIRNIETDYEIIHYYANNLIIKSKSNKIYMKYNNTEKVIKIKISIFKNILNNFRIFRRIFRFDKSVVCPIFIGNSLNNIIAIFQSNIYYLQWPELEIAFVAKLEQGRVPLHQSICVTENNSIVFGEYSSNKLNQPVPIWKSDDYGKSWKIIFKLERKYSRHIHGCFWDPYEKKVWICSGDFVEEAGIYKADENFTYVELVGRGSQLYRTCHIIFKEKYVYWGMDSPFEESYIIEYYRETGEIKKLCRTKGAIWYAKELENGWMLFGSSIEGGKSEIGREAIILGTKDGKKFHELFKAKKDIFPNIFKSGVISFAEGKMNSNKFYFFGEGLIDLDGKIIEAEIGE